MLARVRLQFGMVDASSPISNEGAPASKPPPRNVTPFSEAEFEAQRPVLLAGVAQYNDGYFFEAHETWEDLWRPSPYPQRTFLQGLIQMAAAFVHLARHEYPGTIGLLDAALEKLAGVPDAYLGIDAGRLRDEAGRARDELAALGPERFESWDRDHLPRIHVVETPRAGRGRKRRGAS